MKNDFLKVIGKKAKVQVHTFQTKDGVALRLIQITGKGNKSPVFLTHGLTLSSEMFATAETKNFVQYLLNYGVKDIWCFDYRGSSAYTYNQDKDSQFSLDDVALFDYPAAFTYIKKVAQTPASEIHCVCHCVGAMSFLMSVLAKATPSPKSIILTQAGFHCDVPFSSVVKFKVGIPLLKKLGLTLLSVDWSDPKSPLLNQALSRGLQALYRESDPRKSMLSFMYGAGHPSFFKAENLLPETHARMIELCGPLPLSYYEHIAKIQKHGSPLKMRKTKKYEALPEFYAEGIKTLKAPILFVQSDDGGVFRNSNINSYQIFQDARPRGRQEFLEITGYGHLDIFVGKNSHKDVFPLLSRFWEEQAL